METTTTSRSGGPRTEEGKARTRFNAVKHGLRSKSALLPGENPEEYYELKTRMLGEWKPQGSTEEFQVEQMLQNQWRLRRIALMEQDLFEESFESSFGSEEEFDANAPVPSPPPSLTTSWRSSSAMRILPVAPTTKPLPNSAASSRNGAKRRKPSKRPPTTPTSARLSVKWKPLTKR
jgi:hypothetical protein